MTFPPQRVRSIRGAGLPIAAVLAIGLATLGVVSLRVALGGVVGDANVVAGDTAVRLASAAADAVVAAVADDPAALLDTVWQAPDGSAAERPRVCVADDGAQVDPGDPWPDSCGGVWGYPDPSDGGGSDPPAQQVARVEIAPPSLTDPHWTVRALVRVGSTDRGVQRRYRFADSGAATIATDGDFDLGGFADDTVLQGSIVAGGVLSAAGSTVNGSGGGPDVTRAVLAGECAVVGAPSAALVATAPSPGPGCANPDPDGGGARNLREFTDAPFHVGGAASVADLAAQVGRLPGGLHLAAGGTVEDVEEGAVPAPDPVGAWQISPGPDPSTLRVRFAADAPQRRHCTVSCDHRAADLADPQRPPHPAAWQDLAVVAAPAAGVAVTDAPTVVGGDGCDPTDPAVGCTPSVFDDHLTIVAGPREGGPSDLWVGGPVSSSGSLALVASGSVVLPWWAQPDASTLSVAAHLVAVGPPPGVVGHPRAADAGMPSGTLNVAGQIAGSGLRADRLGPFAAVTVTPPVGRSVPGWLPGTSATLQQYDEQALRAVDVCDAAACPGF